MLLTRTRAAVLCFGGWGLQTMLHLWPRLRFIQEARYETGIDRSLVELDQVTAFAAILPEPVVPTDLQSFVPLQILRPHSYPDPFYVERALQGLRLTLAPDAQRTYAERLAQALAERALGRDDGQFLQRVTNPVLDALQRQVIADLAPALQPGTRVSRRAMFQVGVSAAELVARTVIRSVIDPTRLDSVQPEDPQVQTTLYVVASLSEPLASALIWPIISELAASIGSRGAVNVTAILATGSFADDDTRVVEEAAAYSALVELEALAACGQHPQMQATLRTLVGNAGKPGWADRVGQPLFRRIYLVDREKSNQALAGSDFELAVLASNTVEAFLVADGAHYLEQQVGLDSPGDGLPYSLLGAASDYVPFAQYVRSAVLEERKRVIREQVLAEQALPAPAQPLRSLAALRATPDDAVGRLATVRGARIFAPDPAPLVRRLWRRVRRRSAMSTALSTQELRVAQSYLLPPSEARRLCSEPTLWRWRVFAEQRFRTAAQEIAAELEQRRFAAAWGIGREPLAGEGTDLIDQRRLSEAVLRSFQERGWQARAQAQRTLAPEALAHVLTSSVQVIASTPNGLRRASAQVASLAAECSDLQDTLRDPDAFGLGTDWDQRFQQHITNWRQRFIRAEFRAPHAAAFWTRIAFLAALITFPVMAWLIYEQPATQWQPIALAAAASVGFALLIGLLLALPQRWRRARLRWERLRLAQEMLSRNAREQVRVRLLELYSELGDALRALRGALQRTLTTLEDWAQPNDPPGIPPRDQFGSPLPAIYLRVAHTSGELWGAFKRLVAAARVQQPDGPTTAEGRLRQLWAGLSPQEPGRLDSGERSDQRLRLALELPLNERDLHEAMEHEAHRRSLAEQLPPQPAPSRRRQSAPPPPAEDPAAYARLLQAVEDDRRGNSWCPFAAAAPNTHPDYCTACRRALREPCPYSAEGTRLRAKNPWHPWSLTALVRDMMYEATSHLDSERRFSIGAPGSFAQLLSTHGVEREALRGADHDEGTAGVRRAFFESLYARAKPSGLFELNDPVQRQALEIAFAVTAHADISVFRDMLAQRKIRLLSSYDPMTITVVRTVNLLHHMDLQLIDRCGREFARLATLDRQQIALTEDVPLYAALHSQVQYEPILV